MMRFTPNRSESPRIDPSIENAAAPHLYGMVRTFARSFQHGILNTFSEENPSKSTEKCHFDVRPDWNDGSLCVTDFIERTSERERDRLHEGLFRENG